ncbi:MAG: hypothetical protein K0U66_04910 [Gammaproteobacteria bacterium]|nr:hypothetical protein [Gammaproteobacteria bacterium]
MATDKICRACLMTSPSCLLLPIKLPGVPNDITILPLWLPIKLTGMPNDIITLPAAAD